MDSHTHKKQSVKHEQNTALHTSVLLQAAEQRDGDQRICGRCLSTQSTQERGKKILRFTHELQNSLETPGFPCFGSRVLNRETRQRRSGRGTNGVHMNANQEQVCFKVSEHRTSCTSKLYRATCKPGFA